MTESALSPLHRKLATLAYFLGRGPAYHLAYLRWKASRFRQRLLPRDYRPKSNAVSGESRSETRPEFFFGPDDVPRIVASVDERDRQVTCREADEICAGRFRFRRAAPVDMRDRVDWNYAHDSNTDWRWDLNRHAYFETLGRAWHYSGDERYPRTFVKLMHDWLDGNPPQAGSGNWAVAFEVAFRVNSWTWALHLFADCPAIDDRTRERLELGIGTHCEYLFANLELNARNNHLLLEAKALYLGALLFPVFRNARRWLRRAEKHLLREMRYQVHEDGVHGEMSTHYHRVIAGELLELLLLLRLNGRELPPDVSRRIEQMAEFHATIARPDGSLPLFGDSSGEDAYARFSAANAGPRVFGFAVPEYVSARQEEATAWRLARLATREPPRIPARSRAFPDGGYYVLRSGTTAADTLQLAFDAGPFGLPIDPHHGHADALSFDLYARGRAWIVDSGVYSTHAPWPWRRYFRGTASHNTICVDGQDQTVLLDSRRAVRLARARCQGWSTGPERDVLDASHDGYCRFREPVLHRRIVWFVRESYWLLADLLTGDGAHRLSANFHAPAGVAAERTAAGDIRLHADGEALSLSFAATGAVSAIVREGETAPIQGWRSVNSGEKTPAPTVSVEYSGELPFTLFTLLLPVAAGRPAEPALAIDARGATVRADGREDRFELPDA